MDHLIRFRNVAINRGNFLPILVAARKAIHKKIPLVRGVVQASSRITHDMS